MAISVDYSSFPYLITIPQSDLTLVSGTQYQITVDQLWVLLRDYADSEEGIVSPIIYRRIPATSSTPPITEINENYYECQFQNGLYSVEIIDGNSNFRDVEVKNQVSVGTNNNTGFINPVFLEASLFEGRVAVDCLAGVPLTPTGKTAAGGIIGTIKDPVDNFIDAKTIADLYGIRTILIKTTCTISTANYDDGYVFEAISRTGVTLTIDTLAGVLSCTFMNLTVQGVLDGNNTIESSTIKNLDYVQGTITNCAIEGIVTLVPTAQATMHECYSGVAGGGPTQTATIDMGGTGLLALRGYEGGLKLTNSTGPDISLDFSSGRLILDSTVTGGNVYVRGISDVEDNSTGTNVLIDNTLNMAVKQIPQLLLN